MKKLLLSFAHPDDESFAAGGTVAKYVAAGWTVHLLCATRGEAGSAGPYGEVSSDSLGNIRQKELEEAGSILGIDSVTFLGYKDGLLSGLTPGDLEDPIYRQMAGFSPDVVITFEPNGISNHPDHRKVCLATTYAFQKYAKDVALARGELPVRIGQRARSFKEADAEETNLPEPRLYYVCMPETLVDHLKKQKVIPSESFGKPWVGIPDKLITTVIDIKRFKSKKIQAIQAHKTQQSDSDRFLSSNSQPLLDLEYFIMRMQGMHEVFMGKTDRVADRI